MVLIAYTQHYGRSHCGTCGESIDSQHDTAVSCELEWHSIPRPMDEAVKFAKDYLGDRREDNTGYVSSIIPNMGEMLTVGQHVAEIRAEKLRAWDVAVEYFLNNIIPHLYGEALD